jgi:hypothetical protein
VLLQRLTVRRFLSQSGRGIRLIEFRICCPAGDRHSTNGKFCSEIFGYVGIYLRWGHSPAGTDFRCYCRPTTKGRRSGRDGLRSVKVMHQSSCGVIFSCFHGGGRSPIFLGAIGGFVLWLVGEFVIPKSVLRYRTLRKGRQSAVTLASIWACLFALGRCWGPGGLSDPVGVRRTDLCAPERIALVCRAPSAANWQALCSPRNGVSCRALASLRRQHFAGE